MASIHKSAFIIMIILAATLTGHRAMGLEVDVVELKTQAVRFINYQGRTRKADPPAEVRAIGVGLAKKARGSRGDEPVRFFTKYSIIRALSAEDPKKLSADIFFIDRDAQIGHIDNVRVIIAAYLETMYGYSPRNARTLALFASYYNAVHRSDMPYFAGKYKGVVARHLTTPTAGIATRWFEWPGATRIVIPLTEDALRGKIDAVDPDTLGDKKTLEEIRKDRRAIPERRDMTDLKEKKLEGERKKLDEEKQTVEKEKQRIADEKKRVEGEKKKIEERKKEIPKREEEIKKEREETKRIVEPEKRKEKEDEIKKKEEGLKQEKEAVKKQEKQTEQKEQQTAEKEKKLTARERQTKDKEQDIKKRDKELTEEKKEIQRDEKKEEKKKEEKATIEEQKKKLEEKEKELDTREDKLRDKQLDRKIFGTKLYYLKVKEYLEGGHYNNDLFMIDPENRRILFKSPVQFITGRRYDVFSGGVVVITHTGNIQAAHRLTLVDRETLKATINGTDNVFWRSFVEINEGFIYAIVIDAGSHYLGKFNGELKLVARSTEKIHEDSFISFWDPYIYINRSDKTIIVIKKEDLSFIGEVKP